MNIIEWYYYWLWVINSVSTPLIRSAGNSFHPSISGIPLRRAGACCPSKRWVGCQLRPCVRRRRCRVFVWRGTSFACRCVVVCVCSCTQLMNGKHKLPAVAWRKAVYCVTWSHMFVVVHQLWLVCCMQPAKTIYVACDTYLHCSIDFYSPRHSLNRLLTYKYSKNSVLNDTAVGFCGHVIGITFYRYQIMSCMNMFYFSVKITSVIWQIHFLSLCQQLAAEGILLLSCPRERESLRACSFTERLLAPYFIDCLWKFCGIFNFAAVGDKDELIRFWSHDETKCVKGHLF